MYSQFLQLFPMAEVLLHDHSLHRLVGRSSMRKSVRNCLLNCTRGSLWWRRRAEVAPLAIRAWRREKMKRIIGMGLSLYSSCCRGSPWWARCTQWWRRWWPAWLPREQHLSCGWEDGVSAPASLGVFGQELARSSCSLQAQLLKIYSSIYSTGHTDKIKPSKTVLTMT